MSEPILGLETFLDRVPNPVRALIKDSKHLRTHALDAEKKVFFLFDLLYQEHISIWIQGHDIFMLFPPSCCVIVPHAEGRLNSLLCSN